MKLILTLCAIAILPALGFGQVFTYEFTGGAVCPAPGSTSPIVQVPHVTVTPLSQVGLNCSPTAASFNSNSWPQSSSIDLNKYIEVTVTAEAGYQLSLASFTFTAQKSASGPASGRIAMDDGSGLFSQTYDFTPSETSQPVNWDIPDFTNVSLYGAAVPVQSGGSGSSPFTVAGGLVGLDKVPTQKLDINGNIRTNGKLFVGDISDAKVSTLSGYALSVNGSVLFTEATVKLYGNWPDYVFNNNYKLRPLAEVEKYIQSYKHLPEVNSAQEMDSRGLDIGRMQATLLKKIEELTLYVIQQNKEIEMLKRKANKSAGKKGRIGKPERKDGRH